MAIQFAQLMAMIGADTRGLERGVSASRGLLGSLGDDIRHMASTAAGFIMRDLIVGGFNQVRQAIENTGREMVDVNRQWETFTTQYTVQLKSQEAALKRLAEVEAFAAFTPFNLDEVIRADLILQNFGLHAQEASRRFGVSGEEIRTIAGDVAAGTRASFDEISMWFGRFAVGDTGQAIMRLQELGVVTRDQLRGMGVEFNKAGGLTSPVDEAFAALLQLAKEKFGGLMQVQSRTLAGMESNFEDWQTQQKRAWGEPFFDAYKEGLSELLGFLDSEAVDQANAVGLNLWRSLTGWAVDVAKDWARDLAGLARDAFYWGANVVREFAAGITGSGYVADALQDLGDQISYWLVPGSPPRILPDLTRWGEGAADAYFAGWAEAGPAAQAYLNDMAKSVAPYLRGIDVAGEFTDAARAQMEEAFGGSGAKDAALEYAEAYAELRQATERLGEAKGRYASAQETGDQAAIDAAQKELDLANEGEVLARRRITSAQMRLSAEARAQMQLVQAIKRQTDATKERSRVEEDAAHRTADREAEAERRRQETEAKRIADARLRWELAQQDTAGQIGIWQRELAGVAEGSAEYYDILTRIIGLEDRLQREREGVGGGGIVPDAAVAKTEVEQYFHDSGVHMEQARQRVDWAGIGRAIAGEIWRAFTEWGKEQINSALLSLSNSMYAWASTPGNLQQVADVGSEIGGAIVAAIQGIFVRSDKIDATAATMESHLQIMAMKTGSSAWNLGTVLGDSILAGLAEKLLPGEQDPADFLLAWDMAMGGYVFPAVGARIFDSEAMATNLVEEFQRISQDPRYLPAIRAAAAEQAKIWAADFGIQLSPELQTETNGAFEALSVLEAGRAGERAADKFIESYRQQINQYGGVGTAPYGPELPPGYARGTSLYPGGWGIVGEEGPELVRLPRGSEILPADKTERALGGTTNMTFNIFASGGRPRDVEIGVRRALQAAGVAI